MDVGPCMELRMSNDNYPVSLALGILNIQNDTPIVPFDFISSFYKMPWFSVQRYFRRISHQKIEKSEIHYSSNFPFLWNIGVGKDET